MKIQILGVGNAFSPELGNSSLFIEESGKGILVDAGYTVFKELKEKDLLSKINTIYITHTHGDHFGSLDTILYYLKYILNKKVNLYGGTNVKDVLSILDDSFFKNSNCVVNTIDEKAHLKNVTLPFFKVEHVPNDPFTFGLYFNQILYSGDTWMSQLDSPFAKSAKIIFHEVSFKEVGVHAFYERLKMYPLELKQKTWLYHYNVGDYEKYNDLVLNDGFAGMLQQDQIIEIT